VYLNTIYNVLSIKVNQCAQTSTSGLVTNSKDQRGWRGQSSSSSNGQTV